MNGRFLLFALVIVAFFTLAFSQPVQASTPHQLVTEQLSNLGIDEVKGFWDGIMTKYGGFLPESQKGTFYEFVSGEKKFSIKAWLQGVLNYLFHEILANGKLLGTLIFLTIFSAVLQSFQNAFERNSISKIAYAIIYMVIIILALNSFHVAISYAQNAITNMMSFIIALVPLILALMASTGNIISVAFFHPLIIFLVNMSGLLIKNFVFPLLFLSAILSIVSTLTEHYKVTQLAQLLRNISIGALGVFITIFLGVLSVQGATTAVADGITVRTAKFVTGNFIPVIGRMFTEATDTVLSASVLLKNTIGLIGVSVLILIAAFPAIKVLSLAIIYKLAAAILQPLGAGPIIDCLDIISKSVIYIFAALAIVSLMFFLTITIIISAGNVAIMMR